MRRSLILLLLFSGMAVAIGAQQLPDLKNTTMEISWQDFKTLIEMSQPEPRPTPVPPIGAFLSSASYRGRMEGSVLRLDGRLEIEALGSGWLQLPLWRDATILSFEGNGATLALEAGGTQLLFRGPGRLSVNVQLAFALPDNPGENHFALHLPDAPVNLLEIAPGKGVEDLDAEGVPVFPGKGGSRLISLKQGRALLKWRRPFESEVSAPGEVVKLEARVHLDSYEILDLGEGALGGLLVLDYRVRLAKISSLDLGMPEGVEVFDVSAPGLESWKILSRAGRRVLHLALAAPSDGKIRALVRFEGAYDPKKTVVEAPRFEAEGIERENGWLTAASAGAEIELQLPDQVLPTDPSELPADIQSLASNPVAACKFSGVPGKIHLKIREHEDAAVLTAIVESLNATSLLLEDGTEALWLDLRVRNNRKQFLRLRLGASEAEIWSLLVDSQPTRPKQSGDAILLPLPRAAGEKLSTISLVLLNRGMKFGSFRTIHPSLPNLDLPVIEAVWTLFLPQGKKYSVLESPFSLLRESDALQGSSGARPGPHMAGKSYSGVSSRVMEAQKAQDEGLMAELKRPKNKILHRGAVPVTISIPEGVHQLPQIQVARVLMVDEKAAILPIRVYPAYFSTLLRGLKLFLLLAAGMFLGLRRGRRRAVLPACALFVVALLLPGLVGFAGALTIFGLLVVFLRTSIWLRDWVGRRRSRRSGNIEEA